MTARIYQPAESAMQSGGAREEWILEFDADRKRTADPLMGWTSSADTQTQVKLRFESKAAALAYANKHGIVAQVVEPAARKLTVRPMGYGGNFAFGRKVPWSH